MRPTTLLLLALIQAPPLAAQTEAEIEDEPCTPTPGTGVIEGLVLDSTTAIPLQGARVSVRWQLDRRGAPPEQRAGDSDPRGRFRVCDAPPGTLLTVEADFAGHTSAELSATLDGSLSASLVLVVDGPHALLEGSVIEDGSSLPVADAEVRLESGSQVRITGADGGFRFGRIPPGTYPVRVTHLAHATVQDTIEVEVGTSVAVTIRVSAGVIALAPITVLVRSLVLERAGFYERRERGSGHFVTRQQIDETNPLQASELLRRIPSVRLQRGPDGLVAIARANCPFRFVIDGVRTAPGFSIDLVSIGDIEGLEVYLGPSQVPGEFSSLGSDLGGTCGVIVVWTRRNIRV